MNLTFEKKGRITLGEREQSKNGSFFYKLGAVVDRQTETFNCSEEVYNKFHLLENLASAISLLFIRILLTIHVLE